MTVVEKRFCIVLLINTAVAVLYVIGNSRIRQKEKNTDILMKGIMMFLCPVVGPLFFLAGLVFNKVFFRQNVDLEDVIFSKERVRTHFMADEEQERNVVPIEEALAISDRDSLRTLIMNVVRGDVTDSLGSLALALDSEDTETSHYAASVLRDVLNDFRQHAQELYRQMQKDGREAGDDACLLIEYMYVVLKQNVFHETEQRTFVDMFEEACELLYEKDYRKLTAQYIEWLCELLLRLKEFGRMRYWCNRSRELYPDALSTYTCYLKMYFTQEKKTEFFRELDRLKASNIVIDRETLELIRTFS